jgi:hypothetical protein
LIAQPLEPESILEAVAKQYGLDREELLGKPRYRDEPPSLAVWLVWERCGLSQAEMRKIFYCWSRREDQRMAHSLRRERRNSKTKRDRWFCLAIHRT